MISRRSFLGSASLLAIAASLPAIVRANDTAKGRLVFGIAPGAVGNQLAGTTLDILAKQFNTDYRLDILDARNTLQASETVKLAPADGSTLLQTQSSSMVLFPSLYRSLAYDPMKDFTPLALMGDYSFALTVGPVVPASVTTVDQYLAWVKENPDFRDIGFSVYGSQSHLISMVLGRSKEIAIRPQSYKSIPAMLGDLQGQTIAAAITVAGNTALTNAKGLRPLAVTGRERLQGWPNVPTFAESGVKDMEIQGWYAWFAPANLPATTAQQWRERLTAVQATPAYATLQQRLLLKQVSMSPEQIHARMRTEMASYAKLVESYSLSQIT
ncbi:tripartite tricarboxylate transporter substrate-binding protein [Pseudomonas baltica]|uniref:tripartite tricarboxylate transporter substrate-binding protein n=1 Tax=Pseudomonas baltica TaxID=2762576 RepID=UPI00289D9359|nr:tripartite tricarboxylate transporter substrate-binding protein [Pseudomonas baltica]